MVFHSRTQKLLHQLAGATRFSKLDLKEAYHQLELRIESSQFTHFITHDGLFRFKRVCFGLASAPAAFLKMMCAILQGCRVLCYIDDIIVWGSTVSEHDKNSEKVLQRLPKAGLKLNDKCVCAIDQLTFLGHVVSKQRLTSIHSKVEAIECATECEAIECARGPDQHFAHSWDSQGITIVLCHIQQAISLKFIVTQATRSRIGVKSPNGCTSTVPAARGVTNVKHSIQRLGHRFYL